jgi:hypothetical protein
MMLAPKPVRVLVGFLCAFVLVSSLGMMGASVFVAIKPVWVLFGFEVVIAVASVIGIMFAAGRYQDGQGLALACVSGTIAVGSMLGWLGAQHHLTTSGGDVSLNGWLLGRVGAALALGLVGALLVLSRNPRSWSYLLRSAITGGPIVLAAGAYMLKRSAMSNALGALPGWLAGIGGTIGAIIAVVLISASVHSMIRAFELGRTDP